MIGETEIPREKNCESICKRRFSVDIHHLLKPNPTTNMYRETLVAVLSLLVSVKADCMIEENPENNVLAERIVGNWTFNADMTSLMGGNALTQGLVGNMVVSLSDEPEVLKDLPDDNCKFLMEKELKIYVAGTLRFFHIEYEET